MSGIEEPVLRVSMEAPVPMFSSRMTRETDVYYRFKMSTQTGAGGYDLMRRF